MRFKDKGIYFLFPQKKVAKKTRPLRSHPCDLADMAPRPWGALQARAFTLS